MLEFQFRPITWDDVKEIDSWDYEGFVEQVWMGPYVESYQQSSSLKGPGGCDGFAVFIEGELVGLYEFIVKDNKMEIGLALKPDRTGKGMGEPFVHQGIQFGIQHYKGTFDHVSLGVDPENKAAIRVYEKVGFKLITQTEKELEMKLSLCE